MTEAAHCLRCEHVHGGRAFGLCLVLACDCIVVTRGGGALVTTWPPQFATYADWRAWCEQDEAAERQELLEAEWTSAAVAVDFEARLEVDPPARVIPLAA